MNAISIQASPIAGASRLSTAHRRAIALGDALFHPTASASDLFGVLFVPDGNEVHRTTLLRITR